MWGSWRGIRFRAWHWRGNWFRAWHRLCNRWWDVLAWLLGACNRSTWNGQGYAGGFAHWRCMRERGHPGLHRFNNYVWPVPPGSDGSGGTEFVPLPVLGVAAGRWQAAREVPYSRVTSYRYPIDSRRRTRIRERAWGVRRAR